MREMVGKVVTLSGSNTVGVTVEGHKIHPKYKKRLARSRKFIVHNELEVETGDMVKFVEVSPISKMKKWKTTEVIK